MRAVSPLINSLIKYFLRVFYVIDSVLVDGDGTANSIFVSSLTKFTFGGIVGFQYIFDGRLNKYSYVFNFICLEMEHFPLPEVTLHFFQNT